MSIQRTISNLFLEPPDRSTSKSPSLLLSLCYDKSETTVRFEQLSSSVIEITSCNREYPNYNSFAMNFEVKTPYQKIESLYYKSKPALYLNIDSHYIDKPIYYINETSHYINKVTCYINTFLHCINKPICYINIYSHYKKQVACYEI